MNPMYCSVCNDARQFDRKVNDANRISRQISMILQKYRNVKVDYKINHDFDFDSQHQHFMCGTCMKVNLSLLNTAESSLNMNLSKFSNLIELKEADINDYHQILRLLSGYYPGKYRVLERIWCKNR